MLGAIAAKFPYYVGASGDEGTVYYDLMGTLLHVLAWVLAFSMDILTITYMEQPDDKVHRDYWLYSFVFFCVAFATLLLSIGFHMVKGIEDSALPPFILTLITSGVLITVAFSFLLVLNVGTIHTANFHADAIADRVPSPAPPPPSPAGNQPPSPPMHDDDTSVSTSFRHAAMWSFMAKVFIGECLRNNIAYAKSKANSQSISQSDS